MTRTKSFHALVPRSPSSQDCKICFKPEYDPLHHRGKKHLVLTNRHALTECWHPQFHASRFRTTSATTFTKWYKAQRYGRINWAAPLCIFGGVSWPRYAHNVGADGTYAVCPKCSTVMMCGYQDGDRMPHPQNCEKCGHVLHQSDYFQPAHFGGPNRRGNPDTDAALTATEIIGLAGGLLDTHDLIPLAAILKYEGLLKSADRITIDLVNNKTVDCPEFDQRGDLSGALEGDLAWLNADFSTRSTWGLRLTEDGLSIIEARKLLSDAGKTRVHELLALGEKKLNQKALEEHLRSLLDQNTQEA